MDKLPRHSQEWFRRFWNRPTDAVPVVYGSANLGGIGVGIESGPAFEDDVPPDVNGFRIEEIQCGWTVAAGGLFVRIYNREVRNTAGPTFNIPQFYELSLFGGPGSVSRYPVAWLIEAGSHWQATAMNRSVAQTNTWIGLAGYYF